MTHLRRGRFGLTWNAERTFDRVGRGRLRHRDRGQVGEQHPRARVIKDVRHVFGVEHEVDRDQHRIRAGDRETLRHERVAVQPCRPQPDRQTRDAPRRSSYSTSNSPAAPIPPPTHMVITT